MSETTILVVDDNSEICRFLDESVLTPAGYIVRSVGDGMSAFTLAREIEPNLVITDNQMPGLTGIDLIRRLRQDMPQLPVILITADGSESLAVEALRAGAVDYLTKPFEAELLLAAVGRALAEGRRWQSLIQAQSEAQANAETLARRLQELETLAGIGRTVTAMLDLDEVLTAVVEASVRLTEAEEGSLLLLDEETGELYMRASKNFDEEFVHTFRLHVQDSLAGQVISSGDPIILDEDAPQKIKTSYLVHSLLYVPLRVRGRVIGVLGVDNRKAGRSLTREDLIVIMAMADYAAIAIENAQLYNRSEAERRKLETVLTGTENAVIVLDPENRLLLINQAAREAFHVNGDHVGRSIVEALDHPRLLGLIRAPGNLPRREEIELEDGRIFNAQRTPIPQVGQAIVMHDITQLKELDRIKSEFVTTVSHDLRSPLTAILGYIELVERAGELNQRQKDFVQRVQMSVAQITTLVTDLLDLGRIEAGLDTTKEATPINVLARYAVEGLRATADREGVKLVALLPEELPMVTGDPIRLRQMVGNLLENAIKYTPQGGTVTIEASFEGNQVLLRVQDTGPGIPPADQPYLFDKFFRASNIPEDTPGTGLGLSIVKSIVDNHNGRIWVNSRLGEGTSFTVVLPTALD
ncbi:MAG TPA: ATP-binding protein [Anaerolineales bacterium]|nr:ATP-binding protein [Anaerolineales bacterium]